MAHLKPIERHKPRQVDDHESCQSMAPAWSFNASGTQPPLPCEETSSKIDAKYFMEHIVTKDEQCTKYTADAFLKEWRKLGIDNPFTKLEFLTRTAAPFELPEIFKVEIPPYLMADILETILTFFSLEEKSSLHPTTESVSSRAKTRDMLSGQVDVEWVTSLLEALPKCGRFPLAVRLMGERMRVKVQCLFEHLASCAWSHCMNAALSVEKVAEAASSLEHKEDPSIIYRLQDLRATYTIDY